MGPLDGLFASDATEAPFVAVEAFVARCLHEADVWPSTRTSDGVPFVRLIEQGSTRVRLCGRIWEINQTLHSFWLDVERESGAGQHATWTLYFGVDIPSPRRARHAVDVIGDPGEIGWLFTLTGTEGGRP